MESLNMTTAELARHWGVGIRTLANWRSAGTGPPFLKITGGRIVYRRVDVEEYELAVRVVPGEAA